MASIIISLIRYILPTGGPAYTSTTSTITSLLNYHDDQETWHSNQHSTPQHTDDQATAIANRTSCPTSQSGRLLATWKENHLSQLNTIGLTAALFGGVIGVSFTWPVLLPAVEHDVLAPDFQSTVTGIWYAALVFALTSIATSAHQAVALNRLGSHPAGVSKLRDLLGKEGNDGTWRARKLELFIWQTPLSLLNTSIIFYAVGLGILVWSSVAEGGTDWTWNDIKVS